MLRLLHTCGSPATVATTGGRFYGLVTGGVLPPVIAVKWLADAWDPLAALYVTSPVVAKLEALCQQWLVDLFALPGETVAGFVSGTSMATLCGLAAARYELLRRAGWDVNAQGLFGAPPLRVVVGAEAHSTVFKALALLGLGRERVELVPTDAQGRMIADQLPALDERTLVIAQAGNVNSGAFDPLDAIGAAVRRANAWLHIDGAFGLWAGASESKRALVRGMEQADSWSVDAHKTLNAPYDGGIILCRRPEALVAALQNNGSYIVYSESRDGMLYTPEMSRRGRAIELWATLKTLGRSGIAELVDQLCARAGQAADELRAQGFNVLNDVVFNQVLVTGDTPEQTQALVRCLQESGEAWCGGAQWHGQPVVRVSVCSWATTAEDIRRLVRAFVAARKQLRAAL
jgi:glutamate/tyrosine decarboxylase-like PLP-dependent enzyme